jgi:putative transposase
MLAVEFPLREICEVLGISRSGYYAWLKRKPSRRHRADQKLLPLIAQIHEQSRRAYGSPRVTQELKRQDQRCGRHRVARIMRQAGLRGLQKRSFRPRTTDPRHPLPIAPNRLKKSPKPVAPNQTWVADITYIDTAQGWLYLAAVMDLYSRKIVGWALADHLKTSLPEQALRRALQTRRPAPGLLHHSDRGVQYASQEYRALLQSNQLLSSMSAQGNCYDNAAMESFFSTLKTELLHRQDWQNHGQVKLAIFDYLETFYNRRRLHSALSYQSPIDFEAYGQN